MSTRESGNWKHSATTRNNNISREHHGFPIDLHAILSSLVHFQGRVRKFQEILKEIEVEDIAEIMEGCLHEKDYHDFFNTREKVFTLVRENIPPPPIVYIPRLISNRVKLNPDIFKHNCPDIFVFKKGSIETFYLTELVRPSIISKFDVQLAILTSRFIVLENEGDWEAIRSLSSSTPVHLISFEKDPPAFILEESSGPELSEIIGNFALPRQSGAIRLHVCEEELIAKYQSDNNNSSGVCICDTSGTGKSLLLASLARKTRQKYPERIVAFISLSQFIGNLQIPLHPTDLNPSNALTLILQHISPSPLAKAILMKALSKTSIQLDLFFDGFDEIPRENVKWVKEILRISALDKKNVKLYVTAKPENRHELETTLGLVAHDIVPISTTDQINFFMTFCIQSGTPPPRIYEEARLKEFASHCLQQRQCLPKIESNIMGNLLHCYLLAQINLNKAQIYSDPGDGNNLIDILQVAPKSFCSIYEIYCAFIEQRFHCEEMQSVNGKMKAFHVDQALKLLFPRDAPDSFFLYEEAGNIRSPISEYVLSFGLLQVQCHGDSVFSGFVHRTFAEFLVAEFFTNFWTNQRTDDTRLLKVAMDSAMFLPLSVIITETHKYGWLKNCQRFDSLFLPINIWLYQFSFPVVAHFINAKLAEYQQHQSVCSINQVVRDSFEKCVKSEQLYHIIICCVSQGYANLLSLIRQIMSGISRDVLEEHKKYLLQKSICVEVENRGKEEYEFVERSYFLLCLAVESSNVTMTEQVFQLFQECFNYNLCDLCRCLPVYLATPLHIAIDKVDCELVEYFVDKISLEGRQLLSFCAHHSYGEALENTQKRIAICQLLLYRNRNLVLEPGFIIYGGRKCTSFLVLVKHVHLDLLKFLILNGADVFVQRGIDGASIVTVAAEYMSSSDFQELIRFLIKDCKAIDVFIPNYTTYQYPLHSILRSGPTLEAETIQMILEIPGISVNEKDGNGKTIIFYALHGHQSISVLEELVRCGAQYKKKDKLIERVLQSATENECSEMVRYLRSFGISVNVRNKEGKTPILLAYRNLKVIKHLVTENANIYALSKSGDSFLHLAANYMTAVDFQELIYFLLMQCKAGDLFRLKNKMGRTPLHVRLFSSEIQEQDNNREESGGGGGVEHDTIEMLLSIPGIKINGTDKAGNNLVLLAVQGRKSIATMRSLVDHGVDYRKCNKKSESVLHLAVDNGGYVDAVRYFLSLPDYLKINQRDYRGQTALERAVDEWNRRNGCKRLEEIIVMLREAEINVN